MDSVDVLILSNGPGEVSTWVRPVVKSLRRRLGDDRHRVRLSLVLSPCPNASGREVAIAQTYPEIDRIQSAAHFFPFLLSGKTVDAWDWRDRGVVIFLGGDQLYPVVIGKRLGYRIVIYGEWDTRWHRWADRFGVMKADLIQQASPRYASKFEVIGDLMADAARMDMSPEADSTNGTEDIPAPVIGILPGSKPAKLAQGVPLMLAIAQRIHQTRSDARFVIPVAPTLDVATLARFADPTQNAIARFFGNPSAELTSGAEKFRLQIKDGPSVELYTEFPAYSKLAQCSLCLTTVGANTAELGAMAVPMLVLLPTQQLDAMRAWDGLPGLLANLPGVGASLAKLINWWFLRKTRLLAWPNIWAGEAIVPELIGQLEPAQVAELALDLLNHPDRLEAMRDRLRQARGPAGASDRFAAIVEQELGL